MAYGFSTISSHNIIEENFYNFIHIKKAFSIYFSLFRNLPFSYITTYKTFLDY